MLRNLGAAVYAQERQSGPSDAVPGGPGGARRAHGCPRGRWDDDRSGREQTGTPTSTTRAAGEEAWRCEATLSGDDVASQEARGRRRPNGGRRVPSTAWRPREPAPPRSERTLLRTSNRQALDGNLWQRPPPFSCTLNSYARACMMSPYGRQEGCRGLWGVRVTPAPNCCGCSRPTPVSRWSPPRPARMKGRLSRDLYPSLAAAYPDLALRPRKPGAAAGADLVFCALPHGASQRLVPELLAKVGHVVDLAADFRLRDQALYPAWYGEEHPAPSCWPRRCTGSPSCSAPNAAHCAGRALVAAPGCYVTAAALALAPLVRSGLVEPAGSSSTPRAVSPAPGGSWPRGRSSARWTRTSLPTGCSGTATHPRWSRSSGRSSSSRPTSPR